MTADCRFPGLVPAVTEIHERHQRFDLAACDVQRLVTAAVLDAAGVTLGEAVTITTELGDFVPVRITICERLDPTELAATRGLVAEIGPQDLAEASPDAVVLVEPFLAVSVGPAPAPSTPAATPNAHLNHVIESAAEPACADAVTAERLAGAVTARVAPPEGEVWTAAEDDILVAEAVALRDMPRKSAAQRVAKRLPGRTPAAIYTRMLGRMKGRIADAVAQAISGEVVAGVAPAVLPAPAAPVVERAVKAQQAVARPDWWQAIEANLRFLGFKGGWSAALDLDLATAVNRGDDWAVIADALGRERGDIRQRWTALTPDGQGPAQVRQLMTVLNARVAKGGAK